MKTTDAIKKQIEGEMKLGKYASEAEIKKANKSLVFLRACLTYLESNPREEFIQKEIVRLETRLDIIKSGFTMPFKTENDYLYRKFKREYLKEHKASLLTEQLSTLRFILS